MIKKNAGLSLIEVLVSITILTFIGIAITSITTRTFKGNTKTELIGNIKQNGQAALAIMEKDIRESDTVVCPSVGTLTILTLLTKNGGSYIRFSMVAESGSTNGVIYREILNFASPVSPQSQLCDLTAYPLNIQSNRTSLTDSISNSAVSLKNISNTGFTVVKNSGFKDTVKLQFDLGPAYGSGSTVENNIGGTNSLNFQTTVQLR